MLLNLSDMKAILAVPLRHAFAEETHVVNFCFGVYLGIYWYKMASAVLRSVRFLRNSLNGYSRFIFHYKRQRECYLNLLTKANSIQRSEIRCLGTVQPATPRVENDRKLQYQIQSLDKVLYKMDLDVRRTGRILKKDIEEIFKEIERIGMATGIQSLLLIRCCGSLLPEELPSERNELTLKIWNKLQELNCPMDISHYNALLKVFLENEHSFSPTEFLSEIEKKGLQPNRVTYQRLIARFCQEGDMNGTSTILEYMKSQGMPVNEAVFNSLIMGHMKAGDEENAKNILDIMRNAQLKPSSETYTALACGYAEKGDLASMKAALQEAEQNEVQLTDKDYLSLIYTLAINGSVEQIDEIIPKMRKLAGYNQDCINLIYMLINHNLEDMGYKLLKTMPRASSSDGTTAPAGIFFIRHLVKRERPFEKILDICEDLKKEGLNDNALVKATESALQYKKIDLALKLIDEMHKQKLPIRAHYFWPILAVYRDQKKDLEIYSTLKTMMDYGCSPDYETVTDYVIPGVNISDLDTVIQKMKDIGLTVGFCVNPIVQYLLMEGTPKPAAELIEKYPVRLNGGLLIKVLAMAYKASGDVSSVMKILKHLYENPDRTADRVISSDWGGRLLINYLFVEKKNPVAFEKLLKEMQKERIALSHASVDNINRTLKGNVPSAKILEQLGTNSLDTQDDFQIPHPQEMNVEDLENHLTELKSKGLNTRGVLRRLLLLYCRNKNVEKAEEVKAELERQGFTFSCAMYAQLMDMYSTHGKLEEVLKYKTLIEQQDSTFILDDYKMLNLATLYLKEKKFDDAMDVIEQHVAKYPNRRDPNFILRNVWNLMKAAAETGDIEWTKRIFENVVIKHQFGLVNNMILGPLIQVYLLNDDLDGAVKEFEKIAKEYKHTPWKSELMRRLIVLEDTDKLQKVTDLSIEIHGEMNTLCDLAICFIETGYLPQAKKIFETPGLRARQPKLDAACERFVEQDQVKELENLINLTRDMFDIDRDSMYYQLIRAYAKQGDVQKALSVWTSMQEEDVQPTARTLSFLGNFLKRNNESVPFVVPHVPEETLTTGSKSQLAEHIKNGDMDKAMELKHKIESDGDQLGILLTSRLIDGLLKKDRLQDSIKLTEQLLARGYFPTTATLRFLLNRLARAADVDTLEVIGKKIPVDLKKTISYHNLLTNAYINGGRHLEVLEKLENTPFDKETFPLGGFLGLLNQHPELEDRLAQLAEKHKKEHNYIGSLNMLWMHHMVNENFERADAILKSTPEFKENLMFSNVMRKARETENETMARKLVECVKSTNIISRAKGLSYGCLINILVNKLSVDEALSVLDEAVTKQGLQLEDFNRGTLVRLQSKVTEVGKTFPYTLPSQNAQSISSSSSSDSSSSDDESSAKQ